VKPNVEVLQQLERVLDSIPETRFDMEAWTDNGRCGTTHCLAGWARLDEWMLANTRIEEIFTAQELKPGEFRVSSIGGGTTAVGRLADMCGVHADDAAALFAWRSNRSGRRGMPNVPKESVRENLRRLARGEAPYLYSDTPKEDCE
jgi:hypothetical protein